MARDIYKNLTGASEGGKDIGTSGAPVRVFIKLTDEKTKEPIDGYGRIIGKGNGISAGIGDDGIGWLDVPRGTYKLILCYAKEDAYAPKEITLIVRRAGETFEYSLKPKR